ncbi:hypothetical protein GTN42_05925, partial [bacterium]|nr:hypothetical protein [bacterium]
YMEWVKKVVPILSAPEEMKKMTAWDNFLKGTPHRIIEFEFDDIASWEKWFRRPEIRKVADEWHDMGSDHQAILVELIYSE